MSLEHLKRKTQEIDLSPTITSNNQKNELLDVWNFYNSGTHKYLFYAKPLS